MNLPNILTIIRVFLSFVFVLILLSSVSFNFLLSAFIFSFACITDYFDGFFARRNSKITDFGKFLDPIADKILSLSAFLCFIQLKYISCIPVILIFSREFAVTSIRLMAAKKNKVISANFLGKIKTVFQFIFILGILILRHFDFFNNMIFEIGAFAVAFITIATGIEYIIYNKDFLSFK